jgi:decaprenyl-phosphate phosphoribosyltransferase
MAALVSTAAPSTSASNRWIRAVRPSQWTKAALVLTAPLVALQLNATAISRMGVAAALACCAASGTYLVNDALDAPADRLHPVKRLRPVAAGEITVKQAMTVGTLLLLVTPPLGLLLGPGTAAGLAAYALLTVAYSTRLKRIAVVDVLTIAAGFVLRVLIGSTATHTPVGAWFLAAVAAGATTVATGKRRSEHHDLGDTASRHRRSLVLYRDTVTAPLLVLSAAALCAAVTGWATIGSGGPHLVAGWAIAVLAPVLVGVGRYLRLAIAGRTARPEMLVRDHILQLAAVLTAAIYLAGRALS